MPFEQMMRELNMSREELGKFGPALLDRVLEAGEPMPFNIWTATKKEGKISAVLRVPKARDTTA